MGSSAGGGTLPAPEVYIQVGSRKAGRTGGCGVWGMEQGSVELGALNAEAGTDNHD